MNMRAFLIALTVGLTACSAESDDPANGSAAASQTETSQNASAAEPQNLTVGSVAPGFELPGSDGNTHRLSDYAGQHVVLAFFPKAFTGG